jgi:DNA-binding phage protein
MMTLTRDFRETVKARAERDEAFRAALLGGALDALLEGDVALGKRLLRNYANATIGFERLAQDLGKSPKSLMRMLGPAGNPTASSLFAIIDHLQQSSGIRFAVARVA